VAAVVATGPGRPKGKQVSVGVKISIDFFAWRRTLKIVRSGPQLEETRGLASVDRINGCVGRVQDSVSAGAGERFAEL
jgi:hypothetical protein